MIKEFQEIPLIFNDITNDEQEYISNISLFSFFDNLHIIYSPSTLLDLEKNWENVKHFVAGSIQADIEKYASSTNVAWNMYLIYKVDFEVSLEFREEIESDKFCCKKYVVDTTHYNSVGEAISSRIPLFSNIKDITLPNIDSTVENDSEIFEKILNKSDIEKKYQDIIGLWDGNLAQVTDVESMSSYLELLKSEGDKTNA